MERRETFIFKDMLYQEGFSPSPNHEFLIILTSQERRAWKDKGLRADRSCGERTELDNRAVHSFSFAS